MKRVPVLVLVVALASGAVAIALRGDTYSELWAQGSDPEDYPIVGFWVIDGLPAAVVCVRYGGTYYSYNPAGTIIPLYTVPPAWWAPLPGGAR